MCVCVYISSLVLLKRFFFHLLNKHFDCSLLLLLLLLGCARGAPKTPKERCSLSCVCVCVYVSSLARSLAPTFFSRVVEQPVACRRFFPKREREYEENQESLCCVLRDFLASPATRDTQRTRRSTTQLRPHQKNNRDHTRREKKHT